MMLDQTVQVSDVRSTLRNSLDDPVARMLLSNSQLTPTQLETLLIDTFLNEVPLRKGSRPIYRASRRRISRGSYNRTLQQAQRNVVRSAYTVLLLGYVGLFDSPTLQPFLELSDTLKGYLTEIRDKASEPSPVKQAMAQLNTALMDTISSLADRRSFKDNL